MFQSCGYDHWQWDNLVTNVNSGLDPTQKWISVQFKDAMAESKIVLWDAMHQPQIVRQANDEVRMDTLINSRDQIEFANAGSCEWAARLDSDAVGMGVAVVDSGKNEEAVASDSR